MGFSYGSGARGDYSKAFSDNPDVAKDIDFTKLVKKPKQNDASEEIIDGVTHDSIGDYMRAKDAGVTTPERRTGLLARLRGLFRR